MCCGDGCTCMLREVRCLTTVLCLDSCYIMLGGYSPFISDDAQQYINKSKVGDYQFHDQFWSHTSEVGVIDRG